MHILDTILNSIFPIYCVSCKISGKNMCSKCLSLCPSAERETMYWIFPIFDYRHPPIKKIIWLIKYSGKKKLIKEFAEILYGSIVEELAELGMMENFKNPILIPIPLSNKRYRERGFNQAQLISEEIVKLDFESNNNYLILENNVLIKIKETEHQAQLKNRNARLRNLSGTFSIKNENKIKNRNIILIDDVTTTGATLTEAKKILKQYGAKKIIAFTIAH